MSNRLICIFVLACMSIAGSLSAKSDIEIVKQRVLDGILGGEVDDAAVSELVQSIEEDGGWAGINYDDLSLTGFENRYHIRKMRDLCLAYQKKSWETGDRRPLIPRHPHPRYPCAPARNLAG